MGYRSPLTAAQEPNPASSGTNLAISIHSYIVPGYFLDTTETLCPPKQKIFKPKIFTIWSFAEKAC